MRIAIFSDTFPPQTNGVANVAYQSAKLLARLGHEIMAFTVSKNSLSGLVESENFKIIRLPSLPALVYPGERLTIPFGLSLLYLKKFKPDIIHIHTPLPVGWEGIIAAKILKIPLIGTHHTFYDYYLKHIKLDYDWMKKLSWKMTVGCYNFCDLVVSPSQHMISDLKEKGLKREAGVLRNSIDTELFRPTASAKEKKLIKKSFNINGHSAVFMGRLSYEKSIDQVIKAFALMLKQNLELKLMIIGDGPEKENLKKLAGNLGVKDKVIFTGFLYKENLARALQANDVFLTACKNEVMPLAILEAMAVALPLVLVKEKGLAERTLLLENSNGFFAKTDDPQDMAEKALKILSDVRLANKFGKKSRLMAEEYSRKKIINLLIASYKNLSAQ